jgi:hypothetical protein
MAQDTLTGARDAPRGRGARRVDRWAGRLLAQLDERGEGLARDLRQHALAVAALSLALAAALEAAQALATIVVGGHYGAGAGLRDVFLKLPWALVVCVGLWLGIVVGRSRPLLTGLAGLIVAPLASLGARATAEAVHGLTLAASVAPNPSPLAVAGLKGLEYAVLGIAVAWLQERRWARASHHAAAGLGVGLVFGGGILALTAASQSLTPVLLVGWLVNELLFPVGCALILFHTPGKRQTRARDGARRLVR